MIKNNLENIIKQMHKYMSKRFLKSNIVAQYN